MSRYGQSSHYSWFPGMESSFIDHLLVRPKTGWRGNRGTRIAFGAEDELEDDLDDLDDEIDEELFAGTDDYGRLYMGQDSQFLAKASPGDLGALLARSGSSGYRGGRATFGARANVLGLVDFEGSELSAFFLGASALVIAAKAVKLF